MGAKRNKADRQTRRQRGPAVGTDTALVWRARAARVLGPMLIVIAGIAAYANSFSGVFILDDKGEIVANEDIRGLRPFGRWLHDPRPLVKLSFAINYAIGGLEPAGYHAVNLAIHLLGGLCLYGISRGTLMRIGWNQAAAAWTGCIMSVIWVVHPLQTQGVTYMVQRAESLMGLLYLLTLYCFIRGAAETRGQGEGAHTRWLIGAVMACALGMASKAVMVTAPVLVLLYDRTFAAGTLRAALRSRWWFYAALAGTWGVLGLLGVVRGVWGGGQAGPVTVGFGTQGISAWEYLLTQSSVVLHYLRLAVLPYPLCLDYDWSIARSIGDVVVPGMAIMMLLGVSVYLLIRRPKAGFLAGAFFILLAPTSSFVPVKDVIFEHRMYLPLAAVVAMMVLAARRVLPGRAAIRAAAACAVTLVLAGMTMARNLDYQSESRMWQSVIAQYPRNARAHASLGVALAMEGRLEEAVAAYRAAVEIDAAHIEARGNLGKALSKLGRYNEAIEHFEQALENDPDDVAFRHSYAVALGQVGRRDEEMAQYAEVVRRAPDHAPARFNLAMLLAERNDLAGAIAQYREVIRISPGDLEARVRLGEALLRMGQRAAAIAEYRAALAIDPAYGPARQALEIAMKSHTGM